MQLPLWAYLLLSAAAIAALAGMVRWLRPGRAPALAEDDALRSFASSFPSAGATQAVAAPDGRAFVVVDAAGGIVGCVALIGLRWTTRRICAGDVRAVRAEGGRIQIAFADFTWPSMSIAWPDAEVAGRWAARFNALRSGSHA